MIFSLLVLVLRWSWQILLIFQVNVNIFGIVRVLLQRANSRPID